MCKNISLFLKGKCNSGLNKDIREIVLPFQPCVANINVICKHNGKHSSLST